MPSFPAYLETYASRTAIATFPNSAAFVGVLRFDRNLAIVDHTWNRVLLYRGTDMSTWMAAH